MLLQPKSYSEEGSNLGVVTKVMLASLRMFYFFFFKKGKGRKHQSVASGMSPTGGTRPTILACVLTENPIRESKPGPFSWQAGTQPTEPHQPGLALSISMCQTFKDTIKKIISKEDPFNFRHMSLEGEKYLKYLRTTYLNSQIT